MTHSRKRGGQRVRGLPGPIGRERTPGERILEPGRAQISEYVNRYNQAIFPITVGIVSDRALPANHLRTYLLIQNLSASNIFVNFGQNATLNGGIQVDPGGNYIQEGGADGGEFVSPQDVYIIGAAAGLAVIVAEGLYQAIAVA